MTFQRVLPFFSEGFWIFFFCLSKSSWHLFFVSCSPDTCVCARARARLSDAFDCLLSNCPEANVLTRLALRAQVLQGGGLSDPFSLLDSERLPGCGPMCVDLFTQRLGKRRY